jgi:site-specific recombinase XerC
MIGEKLARTRKPLNPAQPNPRLSHLEAIKIFDSIQSSDLSALRDRALISLIFYNHLRLVNALGMECKDLFWSGDHPYLRIFTSKGLTERRELILPCCPEAERALTRYLGQADLASDLQGPLLRAVDPRTGEISSKSLSARAAQFFINQRAHQAGIKREISPHEFRAAGAVLLGEQCGLP